MKRGSFNQQNFAATGTSSADASCCKTFENSGYMFSADALILMASVLFIGICLLVSVRLVWFVAVVLILAVLLHIILISRAFNQRQ